MIQEHLDQILSKVQNAPSLPPETKADLVNLLSELRQEVNLLSQTDQDHAKNVTQLVVASTDEATQSDQQPEVLTEAIRSLNASVEGLETSHPTLTALVNRIAVTLSNMGI